MPSGDARLQARFEYPELLEKGRDNAIRCPVYLGSELVAPASGTCTVADSGGQTVSTGAVTVTDSVATYTVASASLATQGYSDLWTVTWALVVDGTTYSFRHEAALVRSQLYPVVTDADIDRRHHDLSSRREESRDSWADEREEAWAEIQNRLWASGKRPHLVMSPTALRSAHLYLTLSIIYRGLAPAAPDDGYAEVAETYMQMYEAAWTSLTFRYDYDQDGTADSDRASAKLPLFLAAPKAQLRWGRGIY